MKYANPAWVLTQDLMDFILEERDMSKEELITWETALYAVIEDGYKVQFND